MNSTETLRRWAVLLLAEVLNLSASVAETILFSQPRWVANLRLMEAELRARGAGPDDDPDRETAEESEGQDRGTAQNLLESYAILNRALRDIEARGMALDDDLIGRMKAEWTASSVVGYLQTCDTQLKKGIAEALSAAAAALSPQPAGQVEEKVASVHPAQGARRGRPGPEKTQDKAKSATRKRKAQADRQRNLAS